MFRPCGGKVNITIATVTVLETCLRVSNRNSGMQMSASLVRQTLHRRWDMLYMSITVTYYCLVSCILNTGKSTSTKRKVSFNIDEAIPYASNIESRETRVAVGKRKKRHVDCPPERDSMTAFTAAGKAIDPIAPSIIAWAGVCSNYS